MKCITDGKIVRRVSDKEAEHYVTHEGWSLCQKKKKDKRFVCQKCGAKYEVKPDKCYAKISVHHKTKDGADVVKRVFCESKQFVVREVFVPVWK